MSKDAVYAHSKRGRPVAEWEPLHVHLSEVSALASAMGARIGWEGLSKLAGSLHDVGKCSSEFQAYIDGECHSGPDHSTAGARIAKAMHRGPLGRIAAVAVACHHTGLRDGADIRRRIEGSHDIPDHSGWREHIGLLPSEREVLPTSGWKPGGPAGFSLAFLVRMILSVLVDADRIATAKFYGRAVATTYPDMATLRDRLRNHMERVTADARPTPVNAVRAAVLARAASMAGVASGLFTMTVPTGGGKTLSSLSFALEHAVIHGMRRVVHVSPYTSIVEQTSDTFRSALEQDGEPSPVLEHHASLEWSGGREDGSGDSEADHIRLATENWDVPVVMTTAVQFFESLFASGTSRLRKIHNLAGSVVVLDEVQAIPLELLAPCMAAIDELARNYGCSVVLCTATQPALRRQDGFASGLDIPVEREIAPDPRRLYASLKRVAVEVMPGETPDAVVAERLASTDGMLCVVNTRAHARRLHGAIEDLEGALHLSTSMCAAHRRQVLAKAKDRLSRGSPTRLVSTSLVEAGVDIDFPEVWRAVAGLESIAQAAGRCNREGRLETGRVVVFSPEDAGIPTEVETRWRAASPVLRNGLDLLDPETVLAYYRELYWRRLAGAFDAAMLDGRPWSILDAIAERSPSPRDVDPDLAFPFESISRAFRMVRDDRASIIVPWAERPGDMRAEELVGRVSKAERPSMEDLRRLQAYAVPLHASEISRLVAAGAAKPLRANAVDGPAVLVDLRMYHPQTGLGSLTLGR